MKRIVVCLLALVLALSLSGAALAETITVFNWYDYIDEAVIGMFESETGIDIKYANFTTNEEMYAKMASGAGSYDVIFPSDYIIERMIKEDGLEPLNYDNIPNAANLMDWLKSPDYDPDGKYSLAYMWGTVGILYDSTQVEEDITSWRSMFDEKYKKNVFMMDSIRDTLGITLKMLGYSMNTREAAELEAAKQALIEQKQKGIVKGYLVDETKDKMVAGEAALALVWSGDAMYAISENEDLRYVVPEEGSNVWVDGMCIPKGSEHKEAAEAFMNFLCREDIARMNMEYIYYCTPIQAVADGMSEEEKASPALNPAADVIANCEFFHDISEDMELFEKIWMEARSA